MSETATAHAIVLPSGDQKTRWNLARVPNHRVRQYTYRSASAVGQDVVAVVAVDAPDDGVSPLVVILSALPRGAPLAKMNVADQRLLFEGFQAFADVLGRRRN